MLKKLAALLMIVLAPLSQARAVYVCDMMGGEVATDCCCEDAHAGMRSDAARTDACCTVSIQPARVEFAAASAISTPQSPFGHGGDAPPAAIDSSPAIRLPAFVVGTANLVADSPRATTRSLYLLTARLRL